MDKKGSFDIIPIDNGFYYIDYLTGEIIFSYNEDDFEDEINQNLEIENRICYDKSKTRFENFLDIYDSQNKNEVLHIIIIPTYSCNFECTYCYECKNNFFMNTKTLNKIKKFIYNNHEKYNTIFIEWFGGEPLLAKKHIESIMTYVKTLQKKAKFKLHSHITTNGYLLDAEYFLILFNLDIKSFTVTIDGTKEYHDKQRYLKNGKGSFNKIIDNLKNLHKSNLDFSIKLRCNITKDNISGVDNLLEFWSNTFFNDPRFQDIDIREVSNYNNDDNFNVEILNKNQSDDIKFKLLKKYTNKSLIDKSSWHYTSPGSCICYASEKNSLLISPTGNILKCTIILESEEFNKVGYLDDFGNIIYNDNLNYWIDIKKRFNEKCNNSI